MCQCLCQRALEFWGSDIADGLNLKKKPIRIILLAADVSSQHKNSQQLGFRGPELRVLSESLLRRGPAANSANTCKDASVRSRRIGFRPLAYCVPYESSEAY